MRIALTTFFAMALASQAGAQQAGTDAVEAPIIGNNGKQIGTVALRGGQKATVAQITINAGGLTPGWHGIHLHAVGDCSDTAQFQASKGHVNHSSRKHGLLNPEGPDDGDLPNIFANADGSANAEVHTATLLTGQNGLKDQDGSAIVIHAGRDDHSAQPIGGAGARVACAVIK